MQKGEKKETSSKHFNLAYGMLFAILIAASVARTEILAEKERICFYSAKGKRYKAIKQ